MLQYAVNMNIYPVYKPLKKVGFGSAKQVPEEYKKIASLFIKDEKEEVLLTLMDLKPAAYLYLPNEKEKTFMQACKNLDKSKFSVITSKKDKEDIGIFLFNLPLVREKVNQNIDYFKKRLGNENLNTYQIMMKLTNSKSPLFNIDNNHDLIGICLGYPVADSMLFQLEIDANSMLENLEKTHKDKCKQGELLRVLSYLLRPDKYSRPKIASSYFKNPPMPESAFPSNLTYTFTTWDKNSNEVNDIKEKLAIARKKKII